MFSMLEKIILHIYCKMFTLKRVHIEQYICHLCRDMLHHGRGYIWVRMDVWRMVYGHVNMAMVIDRWCLLRCHEKTCMYDYTRGPLEEFH